MCNLYRMENSATEVARHFRALNGAKGSNAGELVYPGYPGLVVADGMVRSMSWGFPLERKGKSGKPLKPKPVNNTRTDKLDSFFWRSSFQNRRCIIPVTAWAEAEGESGAKTRSWFSLPNTDIFAVAGLWRSSDAFGECYSMVMTDATGIAADVHDRMPVLLAEEDWWQWTDGSPEEAKKLCRAWTGALDLDRTQTPWAGGAVQQSLF